MKVVATSRLDWGVGEIVGSESATAVLVRYYTAARSYREISVPIREVKRKKLTEATRIYVSTGEEQQFGYVLQSHDFEGSLVTYWVKLGGVERPSQMREDQFSVRSALPTECSALDELKHFTQETPFFFERRNRLLSALARQRSVAGGLTGLLSAKVLLLSHQMQVCARIGTDPVMRYLLADEVGLGKTIEAGATLRQALIDAPNLRAAVFVPSSLIHQWRSELDTKFDLSCVPICSHDALGTEVALDFAIIDEAHRLAGMNDALVEGVRRMARTVKHLLLLTATPGLHDAATMLRLLALLDPEHYASVSLEEFQARMEERGRLGQMVLALQNSRTPAIIRRQLVQLSQLLPNDHDIQRWAEEGRAKPNELLPALRDAVMIHVGETYRLHRRMLRTRRKWVLAEQPQFSRNIDVATEYALEESPADEGWRCLENWRQAVAARLTDASDRRSAADAYFALAEALASDPEELPRMVDRIEMLLGVEGQEVSFLEALRTPTLSRRLAQQADQFAGAVLSRFRPSKGRNRGVIFCPNAKAAKRLAVVAERYWKRTAVALGTRESTPAEIDAALHSFHSRQSDLFVTDELGEEGLNLQDAQFMIWMNIPWSPVRAEQRTGRLDRIDRVGGIQCRLLISGEDEEVHLDEAWRQLLVDGLGLFRGSISDLAHLVAREWPQWRDAVFSAGPAALGSIVKELPSIIEKERVLTDEQDVIDGLQWSAAERKSLDARLVADAEAEQLEDALCGFLADSVRLRVARREEDGCLIIGRDSRYDPLLPPEQIEGLRPILGRPVTAMRAIAVESPDAAFFRPGHPGFSAVERLLAWDDRGRAFAFWRRAPEWQEPRVMFRCAFQVRLRLEPAWTPDWDELERANFARILDTWFAPQLVEEFVQPDGSRADARMIELSRAPYDNSRDLNLAKHRTSALRDEFGAQLWTQWCEIAVAAGLNFARHSDAIIQRLESARRRAADHFTQRRSLLLMRQKAGWDEARELTRNEQLSNLAQRAMQSPEIIVDTLGAYVMSAKAIAPA